jgi:hypothetical protein
MDLPLVAYKRCKTFKYLTTQDINIMVITLSTTTNCKTFILAIQEQTTPLTTQRPTTLPTTTNFKTLVLAIQEQTTPLTTQRPTTLPTMGKNCKTFKYLTTQDMNIMVITLPPTTNCKTLVLAIQEQTTPLTTQRPTTLSTTTNCKTFILAIQEQTTPLTTQRPTTLPTTTNFKTFCLAIQE